MSSDDRRAVPGARPRLVNPQKLSTLEKQVYLNLYPYPDGVRRPSTRADCVDGGFNAERPCPFVSCRHHLALEVMRTGAVLEPFGDVDVDEMPETCSLDVTDHSPAGWSLVEVGFVLNLTRERVRQLEEKALRNLRRKLAELGVTHGMGHEDD